MARTIGWERTTIALTGRTGGAIDPDTWWTGALFSIAEVNVVLPVWIAGALGLSGIEVGALYAALRIAAAFSWLFGSIVAVITPMLAEALTRHEYARLKRLLWRSASTGAAMTAPVAVVGMVFAGQLLGVLAPTYQDYGYLLTILIVGRLLDAATGAVAEALVLGDRARWEFFNQLGQHCRPGRRGPGARAVPRRPRPGAGLGSLGHRREPRPGSRGGLAAGQQLETRRAPT